MSSPTSSEVTWIDHSLDDRSYGSLDFGHLSTEGGNNRRPTTRSSSRTLRSMGSASMIPPNSTTEVTWIDHSLDDRSCESFDSGQLSMEEGDLRRPLTRSSSRTLRSMSSASRNVRKLENIDEDLLYRATADAGLWGMGTVYVEVWVQSEDRTHLYRPDGGCWMDPIFHNQEECYERNCSACAIANRDCQYFMPPEPVAPGVGIAGVLWSESTEATAPGFIGGGLSGLSSQTKIVWRDLNAMSNNPHLPYDERLKRFIGCGLGWAAGVRFHVRNQKGVVLYMARRSVDQEQMQSHENKEYLQGATDFIGAAFALRGPRNTAMNNRRTARDDAWRRAKTKILTLVRMGIDFDSVTPSKEKHMIDVEYGNFSDDPGWWMKGAYLAKRLYSDSKVYMTNTAKKCLGSGAKPSPPTSTKQSLFSFFGSLVVLLVLTATSHYTGQENRLILPPLAAYTTLQFGLTQAPAAQPRVTLLGSIISIVIGFVVCLIPAVIWFRQALATSLAIGAMARCGILSPPAGGAAFIFASGHFGIVHACLYVMANIVAMILGAFINNLSEQRQYPTFIAMGLNPRDMMNYLKRA